MPTDMRFVDPIDFYTENWDGSWTKIENGELPDGTIYAKGEINIPSLDYDFLSRRVPWPPKAVVVPSKPKIIEPTRILRSGDRTIVFWNDGTKTIVKRSPDEADNDYIAFTAALAIKMYGSNSKLRRLIRDKLEVQMPKKAKKAKQMDTSDEVPGQLIFDECGTIIGAVDEI